MAAIKGLWYAVMHDGVTVLIISPTQRASNILFRRMKSLLTKSSFEKKDLRLRDTIIRETQTVIEFDNDSAIYSLPAAGSGDNLRGFTANLVIIDEGGHIEDEVYAVIRPMLVTTDGILMVIGTPNGCNNMFFKYFHDSKYKFAKHHFVTEANPLASKEEIEIARDSMSEIEWREEYLGAFIDTADLLFRPADVDKCMLKDNYRTRPEPIYEYFLGYDPATVGKDEAAACVIEYRPKFNKMIDTTPFSVARFYSYIGRTIPQQVKIIEELHKEWGFKNIVYDSTGMGEGIILEMLPNEAFRFSIKTKQDLFFNLKRLIEAEQIILGKNDKLKKQLVELKGERKADTITRISHPKYGHDDLATALALGIWAAKKQGPALTFGVARSVL